MADDNILNNLPKRIDKLKTSRDYTIRDDKLFMSKRRIKGSEPITLADIRRARKYFDKKVDKSLKRIKTIKMVYRKKSSMDF